MINKEEREAIDILTNSIADFVIGDYCERCSDFQPCEGECYFNQAIDTVVNLINKQDNRIKELEEINAEHQKLNGELQEKYSNLENHYNCRLKDIEMLNAHIEKLNRQNEELQEIIDGKVIQELGTSDMYKED